MQWEPGTASRILSGGSLTHEVASNTPVVAVSPNLAARLNKLFEVMHKKSDPPLSNEAAAEAITRQTGIPISPAYLWELRNGVQETNPTVQQLRSIATFFGAPESYLIEDDPDPSIDVRLSVIRAMRDADVRDLAMRASGLTPEALANLAAIIDHIRELEHLPPITPKGQS
ncbi:Nucleoid-associated protein EspR [Mycobacterium attenuatum]|nr:Nucleoid-associated protein EspR [Mycobacterium attenuatum]